jgi:hypothetical protein
MGINFKEKIKSNSSDIQRGSLLIESLL